MLDAVVNSSITYQRLDSDHAQAVSDLEQVLTERNPALLSNKTIVPKKLAQYREMLNNPSCTFWGAVQDNQVLGFAGSYYVRPDTITYLYKLIGQQNVSWRRPPLKSQSETEEQWVISEHPISLPCPRESDRPVAMLFSLRAHPDFKGIGTALNNRRLEDAFNRDTGYVLVDIAADNDRAFGVQRGSADHAKTTILLFGAAHDVSGGNPGPCVTVVHTREMGPSDIRKEHSIPADRVLGKNSNSNAFHTLSWILNGGWVAMLADNQLHLAERPSFFRPASHKLESAEVAKWIPLQAAEQRSASRPALAQPEPAGAAQLLPTRRFG